MGFASKIENLVTELNELQIVEEGEESRSSIIRANSKIAYNSFLNGLSDPQIVATIDASRVSTFTEALEIAEKASSRTKQRQILYQNLAPRQRSVSTQCGKCGRIHGDRCLASGKTCNKCGKLNHFASKCLTRSGSANSSNSSSRNSSNNSNSNGRNSNNAYNRRNNQNWNNRNRNINHVNGQGNLRTPETIQQGSPEDLD